MRALLFSVAFVLLYNIFFYSVPLGIGLGLLFGLVHITYYFNRVSNSKNTRYASILSLLAITFATLIGVTGNQVLHFIDFILAITLTSASIYLYKSEDKVPYDALNFVLLPAAGFINSLISLTSKNSFEFIKNGNSRTFEHIFRGILFTIPVAGILFFLLSNADPVFAKVTNIFSPEVFARIIISLLVFGILFGTTASRIYKQLAHETEKLMSTDSGKIVELSIVVGSVLLLFLVFILVQMKYLFTTVGERELHQIGIASLTYSEYVRKGFFELLAVSAISSGIVVYVLNLVRASRILQMLTAIITVETGIIMSSAAWRLVKYTQEHGLTQARILGTIFLIWLAINLMLLLWQIFKKVKREYIFAISVGSSFLLLFVLHGINMDRLIATRYRPTINNQDDFVYISSLSTDAYSAWEDTLEDIERKVVHLEANKKNLQNDWHVFNEAYNASMNLHRHVSVLHYKYSKTDEFEQKYKNSQLYGYSLESRNPLSFNMSEYQAYEFLIKNPSFEKRLFKARDTLEVINSILMNPTPQPSPLPSGTITSSPGV